MTPKEKAIELFWKYSELIYHPTEHWRTVTIQCALIAVDEIIKYSPNKPDYEFDPIEYFNKVKQEIEKL